LMSRSSSATDRDGYRMVVAGMHHAQLEGA
jgi:hypothetical protein